jgi:4-alpha-glucanotransferase
MIRAVLATVSRLAVVPIQDLLDLPATAALNHPGTAEGNWQWRYTEGQLALLAGSRVETLRSWLQLYNRTGEPLAPDFSESQATPPAH